MRILAGDIGGTKSDLAVYSTEAGPRAPLAAQEYPSQHYASLEAMAREFLETTGLKVELACFDVAGPVVDGRARLVNLPWVLEEGALAAGLGLRSAHLLNDLEAIGIAVLILQPDEFHTLNAGEPEPEAAIGIVAPGTGLGEAFLSWDGRRYQAHPSEGGHADFAPTDAVQIDLLRHLLERHEHVSYERACSGMAIPVIYDFMKESGRAPESPAIAAKLAGTADRTPAIIAGALDPASPCPLCAATVELFVRVLGAEAGNMALKVLALGGVYLGGGLPRRVLPLLQGPAFLQAFRAKGRLSDYMARVPVHVITARAAVLGAASHGLTLARELG